MGQAGVDAFDSVGLRIGNLWAVPGAMGAVGEDAAVAAVEKEAFDAGVEE